MSLSLFCHVSDPGSFCAQPFQVAEVFTGIEGRLVSLKETIRSFKEILAGQHDSVPESAFCEFLHGSGLSACRRACLWRSFAHRATLLTWFPMSLLRFRLTTDMVGSIEDVKAKQAALAKELEGGN